MPVAWHLNPATKMKGGGSHIQAGSRFRNLDIENFVKDAALFTKSQC